MLVAEAVPLPLHAFVSANRDVKLGSYLEQLNPVQQLELHSLLIRACISRIRFHLCLPSQKQEPSYLNILYNICNLYIVS